MADSDRRATERMAVSHGTSCVFAGLVTDVGASKVRDVSMDGIGLILTKRVEVGSNLAVVLSNPAKGFNKTVFVQVAHVTATHGGFLVGGTFAEPLSYQDLTTLVL